MLNNVLTVEKQSGFASEERLGTFTDRVVEVLNDGKENLIFFLWGSHAQRKGEKLNRKKHLVLSHPTLLLFGS